jgi:hypothetical protein
VSNNVHYLDENTVAYPAASVVVVCKTDVKSQMFIPLTPECKGVTAMAITPDRKFMAVAEGGEESPTISIIDVQTLRKRKGLQSRLVESNVRSTLYHTSPPLGRVWQTTSCAHRSMELNWEDARSERTSDCRVYVCLDRCTPRWRLARMARRWPPWEAIRSGTS